MKKIKLTKGMSSIVDDDMYVELNRYKWCVDGRGYAQRREGGTAFTMHQFIWRLKGISIDRGFMTDHINQDKLDNRMDNLRIVPIRGNVINRGINRNNTSGYKGVTKYKDYGKWIAQIMSKGSGIYLGIFDTKEDAAKAYNTAAIELFGDYASLNDI